MGKNIDAISGNGFIGTKVKFANDEMVKMIEVENENELGITMLTNADDYYTVLQFHV